MRIGLLTTSFPRHADDVAGQFVLGLARALAARGHVLEVLAPEPSEPIAAPRWPGVTVRFVPYMRPRTASRTFYGAGVPDNLSRDPLAWLGLAPFATSLFCAVRERRRHWDALVSHWALPCGLIAGALHEHRPHLSVLHSADLHLLSRLPFRAALAAQLARGADHLSFVSERQRRTFLSWLPADHAANAKCHVQPMGFEPPSHSPRNRSEERQRLGLDRFTLLTVARLVPIKGLAEAIQALRDREDLQWLIAGEGPERSRIARLARDARVHVKLLGTVTGSDKAALFRAADAFVLPSRVLASGRSEGMPAVLFEAMSHHLPVIASNVGGISDHVRHLETGLLFDPRKRGALEASLDHLIAEPSLSAALTTHAYAQSAPHAWSAVAARLEQNLGEATFAGTPPLVSIQSS